MRGTAFGMTRFFRSLPHRIKLSPLIERPAKVCVDSRLLLCWCGGENFGVGGVGWCAGCGYVHADVYRNFYWGEAGGVVAGLVAEGDGKSYGADGGVVVGDEAEFQSYARGIHVETFVG
jgi:hypothetical protein